MSPGETSERLALSLADREDAVSDKRPDTSGIVTGLAELPHDAHLDAEALARILGRCKRSVQRAARRGELPPAIRFMGRHVWTVGAILNHFTKRQAEAAKKAARRDANISQIVS